MNKIEQIERLQRLLADGAITQEEFEKLKHQAIDDADAASGAPVSEKYVDASAIPPPVVKPVVTTPNPEPVAPDATHRVYGQTDFTPPARRVTQTTLTTAAAPANNMGKILGVLGLLALIGGLAWWLFKPTTSIQPAPPATAENQEKKTYNTTSQANTSADTEDPFDLNEMQVEEANKTTFKTYRGDNVTEPVAYPTDIVKPKETAPIATTTTGTTTTTRKKGKSADTTTVSQTTTTTEKKVQEFTSPSGDVTMQVVEDNANNVTIAGKYREELNTIGGNKNVTYKLLKDNFFVVTGYKGDNVYYRKTIMKDGKFKTFYTEYPKSKKAQIDPITVRMSRSFK